MKNLIQSTYGFAHYLTIQYRIKFSTQERWAFKVVAHGFGIILLTLLIHAI